MADLKWCKFRSAFLSSILFSAFIDHDRPESELHSRDLFARHAASSRQGFRIWISILSRFFGDRLGVCLLCRGSLHPPFAAIYQQANHSFSSDDLDCEGVFVSIFSCFLLIGPLRPEFVDRDGDLWR